MDGRSTHIRPMNEEPRGILNPVVAAAAFQLTRHAPSAHVGHFVEHYWIVRWDMTNRPAYQQENLPHPSVNAVIERDNTRVYGVVPARYVRMIEGVGQVFGIKFKPGGFYPLARALGHASLAAMRGRDVACGDLGLGRLVDLETIVLGSDDTAHQVKLVDDAMLEVLPAERDPNVDVIWQTTERIRANRDITRVDQAAAALGAGTRSLQRLFRAYVGVSPKWVIRLFRLHEAADRLSKGERMDQAALALSLGYFDQAHFIRDFTSMVGRSPASYAALCRL